MTNAYASYNHSENPPTDALFVDLRNTNTVYNRPNVISSGTTANNPGCIIGLREVTLISGAVGKELCIVKITGLNAIFNIYQLIPKSPTSIEFALKIKLPSDCRFA